MMFSGLDLGMEISRVRPRAGSDRGEEFLEYGEDAVTVTPVEGAIAVPVTGMEAASAGRDATMVQLAVTDTESPKGFWRSTDLVEIDGVRYQIEGSVQEFPSVTGDLSHAYILVNKWEG